MALTDLLCPGNSDRCTVLLAVCLPDTCPQWLCPCALVSRRAHSLAVGSAVPSRCFRSFAQHTVEKLNTACEWALMTGVACTRPRTVVSTTIMFGETSTCRGPEKKNFLPLFAQASTVQRPPR